MNIRQAVSGDREKVCALWQLLLAQYGKQREREVLQRSFTCAVGPSTQIIIFVAEEGAEIIGTASLHFGHYSTWNDDWYGHIEDVVISPEARRRGVGRALVRHIIAVARDRGLARIELHTQSGNKAARMLYEGLGFTTDSVLYDFSFK